jgi:hypothetical protein
MLKVNFSKQNEAPANDSSAMESGDHSKNGASMKSQMSKSNCFKVNLL